MKTVVNKALLRLSIVASLCTASHGAVISVNFVGNAGVDGTMAPTDQAGDSSQGGFVTNWNNAANTTGTLNSLLYNTGAASLASVSWSAEGAWSLPSVTGGTNLAGGANPKMMKGYLDHLGGTATSITMSGLVPTAGTYSVIAYFDGENGGAWRAARFAINGVEIAGEDSEGVDFNSGTGNNANGLFQIPVAGPNGNSVWPITPNNAEGNMVVFSGLTAPSFTLTVIGGGTGDALVRAPLNGIQAVGVGAPIPEPGTISLLAVAATSLLIRRKRRVMQA